MEEMYNKHYILLDSSDRVIGGWSDGPNYGRDITGAICINDQGGYQFRINGGEENPCLFDFEDMIPLYKYENGEVVKRSAEEIEADRAAIPEVEEEPNMEELIDILLGRDE